MAPALEVGVSDARVQKDAERRPKIAGQCLQRASTVGKLEINWPAQFTVTALEILCLNRKNVCG
jgi:hypothetical protein